MSREDVIQLARDVADKDKVDPVHGEPPFVVLTPEELTRFYNAAFKAGAKAMREKCAVLCEISDRHRGPYFADKIRARGEK